MERVTGEWETINRLNNQQAARGGRLTQPALASAEPPFIWHPLAAPFA